MTRTTVRIRDRSARMSTFFDDSVLVHAVDAGHPERQQVAIDRLARAVKDDAVMQHGQRFGKLVVENPFLQV